MDFSLNAGGVFSSGNTRAWTLTAGTHFARVDGRHGVTLDWAFNYGRADLRNDDGDFTGYQDVARNSNAKIRYDFYLTPNDALFVALGHRWDTFAGLDTRLQAQAGYLRNLFAEENHRLWAEVGYDMTYDNFDPDPLLDPDTMEELDGDQVVHSVRGYLGYKNQLNEHVLFTTGLEALIDVQDIDNLRLNYDAALAATLVGSLQVELKFKLLFDNVPVSGNTETDTTTTFSVIYTFL